MGSLFDFFVSETFKEYPVIFLANFVAREKRCANFFKFSRQKT